MSDEQYKRMETLATAFQSGPARKLQFYVWLKWLVASNYVSDWWEDYIYLYGRSPIMVNSNWYGIDIVFHDPPTHRQAARGAMMVYCYARVWENILTARQKPILLQNVIPLCSSQYERLLNTCRIPGEEKDTLIHNDHSDHVVVYCRGRMYYMRISDGHRLYTPIELEEAFQFILDADVDDVSDAERKLPALTAGDRVPWARARVKYFSNGINRDSYELITTAMYFVALDDCDYEYDSNDCTKMDNYAKAMLHGDCQSRWFDSCYTIIIGKLHPD
jgi:carnitine O-palmitoyltransferase 1, liver isoform